MLVSNFYTLYLWETTSRSAFRCAGRGPAVTHLSTDPAKSCMTWVITWHRTLTTHWTLSVKKNILYAFWRSDIATKCQSPITACELSVTRLPHLSGICFIDDREILVQGLLLRCRVKQLVPQKSRALYISLLISIVPETAVLWSYGDEFLLIVQQAGFNSRYLSRIGKKSN